MKRKIRLRIQSVRRESMTVAEAAILSAHCPTCEREVQMLSRAEAYRVLELEEPALDVLILANVVHAIETVSGNQKICKDSLFARTKSATA